LSAGSLNNQGNSGTRTLTSFSTTHLEDIGYEFEGSTSSYLETDTTFLNSELSADSAITVIRAYAVDFINLQLHYLLKTDPVNKRKEKKSHN